MLQPLKHTKIIKYLYNFADLGLKLSKLCSYIEETKNTMNYNEANVTNQVFISFILHSHR